MILGQDPYHNVGQAMGLSFSVPEGCARPPSLLNIYKELREDVGFVIPPHGNLEKVPCPPICLFLVGPGSSCSAVTPSWVSCLAFRLTLSSFLPPFCPCLALPHPLCSHLPRPFSIILIR